MPPTMGPRSLSPFSRLIGPKGLPKVRASLVGEFQEFAAYPPYFEPLGVFPTLWDRPAPPLLLEKVMKTLSSMP